MKNIEFRKKIRPMLEDDFEDGEIISLHPLTAHRKVYIPLMSYILLR